MLDEWEVHSYATTLYRWPQPTWTLHSILNWTTQVLCCILNSSWTTQVCGPIAGTSNSTILNNFDMNM